MHSIEKLVPQIIANMEEVLSERSEIGKNLWTTIVHLHPADIAKLLERLKKDHLLKFFLKLPEALAYQTYEEFDPKTQAFLLEKFDPTQVSHLLQFLSSDALTDLFDHLPETAQKQYLLLIQKQQRHHLLSALSSQPKTAGRLMNMGAISLKASFSVGKSIEILQKYGKTKESTPRIYITDEHNVLVGYISMDDLFRNSSEIIIGDILRKVHVKARATDYQDHVAAQLLHYNLLSVPVVDLEDRFLGTITAHDVLEIIEEEATDDMLKMAGVTPSEAIHSYFQTTFFMRVYSRIKWLIGLLLLQSASSVVMAKYEPLISAHTILSFFLTMLIGTGGNAGNQSTALVIRGLVTGEIHENNRLMVILHEFGTSLALGLILFAFSFARVYYSCQNLANATIISLALFAIVIVSIFIGTITPLILERCNIDPTSSAAPFLATVMDIIGVTIYFSIAQILLS